VITREKVCVREALRLHICIIYIYVHTAYKCIYIILYIYIYTRVIARQKVCVRKAVRLVPSVTAACTYNQNVYVG